MVLSFLPVIFWRQQIGPGRSYCAASWRFSLTAWCNTKKRSLFVRKMLSSSWCNGSVIYVLRLLCQWFSVRLSVSPCRLSFFFFAFFLRSGVMFRG